MNQIAALHRALSAVCPVDGVSSNGRIDFAPTATPAQQDAARAVQATFDPATVPVERPDTVAVMRAVLKHMGQPVPDDAALVAVLTAEKTQKESDAKQ